MRDLTSLKLYADVITFWRAKYNTAEIAAHFEIPEHVVARWVANFREVTREAASA